MKIVPTQDYLVVAPIRKETKTKHGFVEENEQDNLRSIGIIDEVGFDVKHKFIIGDKVFYRHFPINEIGEFVMVKEEDILAIIEEE